MGKELMEMLDKVLIKMADTGEKSAKILLLDDKLRKFRQEIINKYCFNSRENEREKSMIINFYEQIIQLTEDFKNELEK